MTEIAGNIIRKAFIFAAGRGIRFHPYSFLAPKPLFKIEGVPLLARNIEQINASFPELHEICVLAGMKSEMIGEIVEGLECKDKINIIRLSERTVEQGLIGGFGAIEKLIDEGEAVLSMLGDEYYGGGDHAGFAACVNHNMRMLVGCVGVKRIESIEKYMKNYAVVMDAEGIIGRVVEKPKAIISEHYGLGMMAVRGILFKMAANCIRKNEGTNVIDLLNRVSSMGYGPLSGYEFRDVYVNVNTPTDIYDCLRQVRSRRTNSVDVIIPAWNEAESISYVVKDFKKVARSVIVMDNRSLDGTAEAARAAGAFVYSEQLEGYGDAIRKGLDRSDADILVVVEADGTFRGEDVGKLLTYIMDADAVIGSRTYWQYVEYGANMGVVQRMANIVFGMIITLLWWNRKSRFTDVGCTYRAIWRRTYLEISSRLKGTGPEMAPEMVIELLEAWKRVIEVPVPYHARRMGESKFSGRYISLSKTALRMLSMIIIKRGRSWLRNAIIIMRGFEK